MSRYWSGIVLCFLCQISLRDASSARHPAQPYASGSPSALQSLLFKHAKTHPALSAPQADAKHGSAPPYQPTIMLQAKSAARDRKPSVANVEHTSSSSDDADAMRTEAIKLPDINDVFSKALAEVENQRIIDPSPQLAVPVQEAVVQQKWPSMAYEPWETTERPKALVAAESLRPPVPAPAAPAHKWPVLAYEPWETTEQPVGPESSQHEVAAPRTATEVPASTPHVENSAITLPGLPMGAGSSASARAEAIAREAAESMLGAKGVAGAMDAVHIPTAPASDASRDTSREDALRRAAEEIFGFVNGTQDMHPLPDFSWQSLGDQEPSPTRVTHMTSATQLTQVEQPTQHAQPASRMHPTRSDQPSQSSPLAQPVHPEEPTDSAEPESAGAVAEAAAAVRLAAQEQLQRQSQVPERGTLSAFPSQIRKEPARPVVSSVITKAEPKQRATAFTGEDVPRNMLTVRSTQPHHSNEVEADVAAQVMSPPTLQPKISAIPTSEYRAGTRSSHWRSIVLLVVGVIGFIIAGYASDVIHGAAMKRQLCIFLLQAQAIVYSLSDASVRFVNGSEPEAGTTASRAGRGVTMSRDPQQQNGIHPGHGVADSPISAIRPPCRTAVSHSPQFETPGQSLGNFVPTHPTKLLNHAGLPSDDTKLIIPLAPLRLLEWSIEILGLHGVPLLHAQTLHQRCSSRQIEVATLGVVGTTLAVATDSFQLMSMGGVLYGQIVRSSSGEPSTSMDSRRCEVRGAVGDTVAMVLDFDENFWLERVTLPATGAVLASLARRGANTLIHGEHLELSVAYGVDSSLLLAIVLAVTTFGLPRSTGNEQKSDGTAESHMSLRKAPLSFPEQQAHGQLDIVAKAPVPVAPIAPAKLAAAPQDSAARQPPMATLPTSFLPAPSSLPLRTKAEPGSPQPVTPTPRSCEGSNFLSTSALSQHAALGRGLEPSRAPSSPPTVPPMPFFRPAPLARAPSCA